MRSDRFGLQLGVVAALGIAVPLPATPMAITMPLCGGGSIVLKLRGRHGAPEAPGACHSGCVARRDDDDAHGCP